MAKAVEVTFAIGATLGGSFNSTFGKAGQSFEALQKQLTSLQQQSGQISDFQKLQETVNRNQASMDMMRQNSQALDTQIAASSEKTAGLKSQYGDAQSEVERLNAVLVRNRDAYNAAKLNAESLRNQIQHSTGPTAELQKRYEAAQAEARRLGEAVNQSSASLKNARANAKRLNTELKASSKETKDMQRQSKDLTTQADKLQTGLDNDRKALARMKLELSFAGVATRNLTEHQAQLEAQTKRVTDAQNRLKAAQANYEAARQNLSWNNIKGDVMASAGLAYSLYKPVKQAADFEAAMARVNAVAFTGLGKSEKQKALDAEEFQKMQAQARELGRATQYTAVQVANTQEVLARAGFKSNEVISAMPGLLSMAAAEGMDLSSAADIAASTLRGFQLSADQSNRVADVLAQTSAASNTSIAGLGESMKMVAPVAASLGVSIEQTSAMLGVMANNGIKGTESGSALRNAFLRLSQEPKAVAKSLAQLGIASRTADGNMRQLPDLMLELSEKMKNMGEADKLKHLSNIFGVRAASGMLAVMQGAVDGSLDELERLNKEATGIFVALSDNVAKATGGKFTINTEEMRAGMKDIEPMARNLGISFRDLSIYTALLAKSGIKGANANLMMSQAFTQLSKNSKGVQKALKRFNISAYTKDGKLKDFPDLLREIGNAISGLDEKAQKKTLSQIFGGDDAAIAAQTWIKGLNDGSWFDMGKAAEGAKGVSYQMMEKQLATFSGQWEIAKSATQDFMIQVGNSLLPFATDLVKSFGEITAGITKIMQDYPVMSDIVVKGLGAIAGIKITKTIANIGEAILKLPGKWLEVQNATVEATRLAGTLTTAIGNSSGEVSNLRSLIQALTGPIGIVIALVVTLAMHWEDVCKWCEKAGQAINSIDRSVPTTQLNRSSANYGVRVMESAYSVPEIKQHAMGGIITTPTLSWVGEAGREAIIPLERQARGTQLWIEAGRELGILNTSQLTYDAVPSVINALKIQPDININTPELQKVSPITPHAMGGIFSQPHVGLVAETGREAIIPLEKQSRGMQIWIEAGRELGLLNNSQQTYNSLSSDVSTLTFQPDINIPELRGAGDTISSRYTAENVSQRADVISKIVNALKIQNEAQNFGINSRISEDVSRSNALDIENLHSVVAMSNIMSLLNVQKLNEAHGFNDMDSRVFESFSRNNAVNINVSELERSSPITPHATGGIFSQPHVGLVAEAGREAVIPLEKRERGTQLWIEAGRELGVLRTDFNPLERNSINIMNRISSQEAMRIQSGLNAFNSQSEVSTLLGDNVRGISLWEAAENDNFYSRGGLTENNNVSSPSFVFSPNITVTVNGGSPEAEQEYKQMTEDLFEEMFAKFEERMQRVRFDD